jgi:hypothetical protein
MTHDHVVFLQGVCATAAWVAGLVFIRFWRRNHESLFGYFGVAFWLLGLSWALLALLNPVEEARPYIYGLRLLAFGLIIVAMVRKNLRPS